MQVKNEPATAAARPARLMHAAGGLQAHMVKSAGTSDMLAWLDAKIAAQASLVA